MSPGEEGEGDQRKASAKVGSGSGQPAAILPALQRGLMGGGLAARTS